MLLYDSIINRDILPQHPLICHESMLFFLKPLLNLTSIIRTWLIYIRSCRKKKKTKWQLRNRTRIFDYITRLCSILSWKRFWRKQTQRDEVMQQNMSVTNSCQKHPLLTDTKRNGMIAARKYYYNLDMTL